MEHFSYRYDSGSCEQECCYLNYVSKFLFLCIYLHKSIMYSLKLMNGKCNEKCERLHSTSNDYYRDILKSHDFLKAFCEINKKYVRCIKLFENIISFVFLI